MLSALDPVDIRLLDGYQRDFPVVPRPFDVLAGDLGITGDEVLQRLGSMQARGWVTRVGATVAPNTIAASTLVAMRVSPEDMDEVAACVVAEKGVNHAYEREHEWNFWFVATGPDRDWLDQMLARLTERCRVPLLDLPLVRAFNVDLGFGLTGPHRAPAPPPRRPDLGALREGDRAIVQRLTEGLALDPRPFRRMAEALGRDEGEVMDRIRALDAAGIISRLGVIVRHRPLGWTANAMVVWDLAPDEIDRAGPALAAHAGITLAYERRPVAGVWPYRLFTMIHGRSRDEALATLKEAKAAHGLEAARHEILFSTRCFKQTGALVAVRDRKRGRVPA